LYIERLRLKGFKSFGGSHDLPFSPGMTAVVGPNGSGKSNILDALAWVLGEGSPMKLRISRQQELLFQGTAASSAAKECDVILTLRDSDRVSTIRRTFSPDTGSVLFHDGQKIRLQDLDEVKRMLRLGGETFAFIGQGEVAETIRQRPLQRRMRLEVLFGIDQYRRKRNETDARLAGVKEEMGRLTTLIAELSRRREEIAPAVETAAKARELLRLLDEHRKQAYHGRRTALERRLGDLAESLSLLEIEGDDARRWRVMWERGEQAFLDAFRKEREAEKALLSDFESVTRSLEAARRVCVSGAGSLRSAKVRKAAMVGMLSKNRENLFLRDTELRRGKEDCAQLRRNASESASNCSEIRERVRRAEAEQAEIVRRREALENRINEARVRGDFLERRSRSMREERTALERDVRGFRAEETTLVRDFGEKRTLVEEFSGAYSRAVEAKGAAATECQVETNALHAAVRTASQIENAIDRMKDRAEQALLPEPVRFLLSAARLGKLTVGMRMVADAFSCPDTLTNALEAYLGGRQYWLAVASLDDAKRCIDLLKSKQAGRTTFLPLDQISPRTPAPDIRLSQPGFVGWAADLVRSDPEWDRAVRHLLGDVLVVECFETVARNLSSHRRFPVVTLDGEVFAATGSVSGGKRRASEGAIAANSLIREQEEKLAALRTEIDRRKSALGGAEGREREATKNVEDLKERLQEERLHAEEMERHLERLRTAIEKTAFRLAELSDAEKTADSDREETVRTIASCEEELSGLIDGSNHSSDTALLSAAESADALCRERLRAGEALVARLAEEFSRASEAVRSLERDMASVEIEIASLWEKLRDAGNECARLWRRRRDVREELSGRAGARELEDLRLARLRKHLGDAGKRVSSVDLGHREVDRQIENVERERAQLIDSWEEQYPYPGVREGVGESDLAGIWNTVRRYERDLKAIGAYDLGVLSEDSSLADRIGFLNENFEDLRAGETELCRLIEETDRYVGTLFGNALTDIAARFSDLFRHLLGGGEARLELLEGDSFWDSGVDIVARPPGKKMQSLAQLSGGEQSLTGISLLFACMEVAAVPLAVLDEVDAALDEYNLLRFAALAREYATRLQLIVMTHRRATMERADVLYGVTMSEPGLSQVVGINLEDWR
jgi:chromosome segregation protein